MPTQIEKEAMYHIVDCIRDKLDGEVMSGKMDYVDAVIGGDIQEVHVLMQNGTKVHISVRIED